MPNTDPGQNSDAIPTLVPPGGSATWEYSTNCGINIWTWKARRGLTYRVTQHRDNILAHITTGEAHKFTRTIGHYATADEARQRCVDDWPNSILDQSCKEGLT